MLDAYIIDAIRRRERAAEERGRARLELPLDPHWTPAPQDESDEEPDTCIVIIPVDDDPDDENPESEAA